MFDYIPDALANSWVQFKLVALVFCGGLMLEALRPAERAQPLANVGFNIGYAAIFVLLTNLLLPPLSALTKPLIASYGPHIPIIFSDSVWGQVLQALVFLAIYDFFYYWWHRSQHAFSPLWSQHKLHHTEESLNVTTGTRHHWLEEPIRVFVILLPIGLLFDQKPVTITWIGTWLMLWGFFIHSNLRITFGRFTPVFSGPHLHRLHHSIETQHCDKNFAAFYPLYDILFGTYCAPKHNEYPATGLASGESLNGFWLANVSPFREWGEMLHLRRKQARTPAQQRTIDSPANSEANGKRDDHVAAEQNDPVPLTGRRQRQPGDGGDAQQGHVAEQQRISAGGK